MASIDCCAGIPFLQSLGKEENLLTAVSFQTPDGPAEFEVAPQGKVRVVCVWLNSNFTSGTPEQLRVFERERCSHLARPQ